MTAKEITFIPPEGLVISNPEPDKPPLFALFTKDWLRMQSFIVSTLALPITSEGFEAKYGQFTDENEIKKVVSAMQAIQGLSADFGDPKTLMQELANNPTILQTPTPPKKLYTHIVWFADKLYHAATSYNQTLSSFMELLNPVNCGSKEQCGTLLKEVLTGPGGLQSTATDMVNKANDLIQALATFATQLEPSVETMTNYTASSSTFYSDVTDLIGQDAKDIETYQNAAEKAHKEWENYTIAATTTSVGVMVLSGGLAWPVAAGLAGGLGYAAAEARKAYDKAEENLASAEADKQKKMLLQHDLGALNKQMPTTLEATKAFQTSLQQVTGVWTQTANNLNYIATTFTPEQLGDLSWVMQAMKLNEATQDWQIIAKATKEYTSNSLVSFDLGTFGQPLPTDKAA